jgi:HD-GYP domain-containing protein (c-di-GMP phosphodiesterase class II)
LEVIASLGYGAPLRSELIQREARLSLTKGTPEIRGRSRLLVPLQVEERTIGVLGLGEKQNRKAFNSIDLKLLTTVASQVAVLVENARLYADLEALFLGVVQSLISAIEARDPSTKGHSDRVKTYALEIGRELYLSEPEMRRLELASLLHDIGKIGYSDAIFTNPTSTLSKEHWKVVERHSQVSEMILTPLAGFADIVPSIRWHHERYDGKGYPDGLKGEQIPLLARIVSVVDSYDAMTSERSYRKTFTQEEAVNELVKNSGGQFDPRIVDVFVRLSQGKESRVRP